MSFLKSKNIKIIINLLGGILCLLAYIPVIFWGGVVTVFADSFNPAIPFYICLLALIGVIYTVILIPCSFLKSLPYRVDTLFMLPAFIIGVFTFNDLISPNFQTANIDKFIIPTLCSVGVAWLLEAGFLIWMCTKFFVNKIKKASPLNKSVPEQTSKPVAKKPATSQTITPVLDAILSKDITLVQAALQEYPEQLNTAYAQNGNTPLHVATLNGYTDIVRLLLEQPGIDKTRTNNEGKTALVLAQEKGFDEIVNLLQ